MQPETTVQSATTHRIRSDHPTDLGIDGEQARLSGCRFRVGRHQHGLQPGQRSHCVRVSRVVGTWVSADLGTPWARPRPARPAWAPHGSKHSSYDLRVTYVEGTVRDCLPEPRALAGLGAAIAHGALHAALRRRDAAGRAAIDR